MAFWSSVFSEYCGVASAMRCRYLSSASGEARRIPALWRGAARNPHDDDRRVGRRRGGRRDPLDVDRGRGGARGRGGRTGRGGVGGGGGHGAGVAERGGGVSLGGVGTRVLPTVCLGAGAPRPRTLTATGLGVDVAAGRVAGLAGGLGAARVRCAGVVG